MLWFLLLLLAVCVQQILAVDLVVDLGYAQYRGSDWGNGITRWAGMRYARSASRLEGMRFMPPADPLPTKGIVNATQYGPVCIGTGTNLKFETGGRQSEDCLFANVFAPSNATTNSSLPVFVFIQGGGFNENGNANYNGSLLIKAAQMQMVVVNFNYRVGPYGFLASKELAENKTLSLNNGLKDQRQLLMWVQKHIKQFGGDPNHVTLGGASAGAGSVVFHLLAYGGRNDNLFHAAAVESPATPAIRNVSDSQWMYNDLLKQAECSDLECLRTMDAVKFQSAVRSLKKPFPGAKDPPLYFWNPTLDYDFIRDYEYNEFEKNHFLKVPTIFGDATNEGLMFTPKSVASQQKAITFVQDQFPNLNKKAQAQIQSVWTGPTNFMNDGRWRNVAGDVYGHIRYQCPCLNFSSSYADNGTVPTWSYRWNVGAALHVAELGPIWFNGTTASRVFIQSYWASFIRSYDPNKHVAEYYTQQGEKMTSPNWEEFGDDSGKRMLFDDENVVQMEEVTDQEWDRCDVVSDLGLQMAQVQSAGNSLAAPSYLTSLTALLALFYALYG